jgi:hypothetical protein
MKQQMCGKYLKQKTYILLCLEEYSCDIMPCKAHAPRVEKQRQIKSLFNAYPAVHLVAAPVKLEDVRRHHLAPGVVLVYYCPLMKNASFTMVLAQE